ncbi:PepSY domain-containing protein [Bacillus cihuensis]|uniref:PepSY domain-containing protein n=1 Tax=Bacillus cihuensis TaxID=1208599 RepID=UPI00041CDF74|nr:PepSY domain-containing protein [Bacillus cihuensis]
MNLMKILIHGALITVGLGAHTMIDNQPVSKPTNAQVQPINELTAIIIALNTSKGGLVTDTQTIFDHGNIKYEVSIIKQETEYDIGIASSGKILKIDQCRKVCNNHDVE